MAKVSKRKIDKAIQSLTEIFKMIFDGTHTYHLTTEQRQNFDRLFVRYFEHVQEAHSVQD